MTSLKTNLFGSTMASTPPLASFPGWTMPVVRAKRDMLRRTRTGDAKFNPPLSLEGVSEAAKARMQVIRDEMAGAVQKRFAALIVEAQELGKSHGNALFQRTAEAIQRDVLAGRTDDGEPDFAGNIPAILKRFEIAAHEITEAHAYRNSEASEVGFVHWMAARGELGGEVLRLVGGLLEDFAGALGHASVPDDWVDDLPDVVMAFVFPGFGDSPKDDAWREARAARFDAILAEVRERRGWGTA